MQITKTSDYALRCVLYLASVSKPAASGEIGTAVLIPKEYVQQILRVLRKKGLVRSELGAGGGYFLAKPAEQIFLYDVIAPFEKSMYINRCLDKEGCCRWRDGNIKCPVHIYFMLLQHDIESSLRKTSIGELLSSPVYKEGV